MKSRLGSFENTTTRRTILLQKDVELGKQEQRIVRLSREVQEARSDAQRLRAAVSSLQQRLGLLERLNETVGIVAAPWTVVKKRTGLHHATPGLLFSDQHYDEVVDPAQVEGLNAYNREIAVKRTRWLLERTILMTREFLSGVKYDGFVLNLAGDTFSGNIHDELIQTNEDTLFGSLLFWQTQLVSFLGGLADEFKRLHIVCTAGNHGRMTRKPRAKFYARDNLDWLLYHQLHRELEKDKRITWNIPESRDAEFVIYTMRGRQTHGDEARGGSGIAGKRTPLALLEHRKSRRIAQARQTAFHVLMYGHWHEYDPGERLLGNGSLKGIDEYALGGEFGFEPPKQALYLVTPEHGVSLKAPIFASNRKAEGW